MAAGVTEILSTVLKVIFILFLREAVKNYLADITPLPGPTPPPTPLAENHFAKRPLSVMGGTPPPLTEIPPSFSGKIPKRAKNGVFVINKVKKGPKRP